MKNFEVGDIVEYAVPLRNHSGARDNYLRYEVAKGCFIGMVGLVVGATREDYDVQFVPGISCTMFPYQLRKVGHADK